MSAPREPFPGSIQCVVKSGDSLYRISQRHGISICGLKLINGLTSNMIHEGLVLNLPGETSIAFSRYAVKAGDTLCDISLKYNTPVGDLRHENGLASDVLAQGQVLSIPLIQQEPLWKILDKKGISCRIVKPGILADKSEHTLLLFSEGQWLKTYHIELGSGGLGDREVQADRRTPEGTYYVCQAPPTQPPSRNPGSRWLGLIYPNIKDAYRGLQRGLIDWNAYDAIAAAINSGAVPPQDTALGGGIGIHGGSRPDLGSDWTSGCIALTDHSMDEVYGFVSLPATPDTPVQCHILSTLESSASV